MVKDYYKTIELKHNQLDLVDSSLTGKPFACPNPFAAEQTSEIGENHDEDASSSAYDSITKYLREAVSDPVLNQTNEFKHLKAIKEKSDKVAEEAKALVATIDVEK